MKKSTSLLFILLFTLSLTIAQTKETFNVGTFTKVSFGVPGKLFLKQGSPQKVELEGDKDFIKELNTRVEDGRLIIGKENDWGWNWGKEDKVNVYVTVKDIDAISVSGSGDLIGQTKIVTGDIDLHVSGSGNLEVEVESGGEIEADVSGSGHIDLSGKCASFNSDVSGSGKVEMEIVIGGKASFGISGSGQIDARGQAKEVKASLSGSGRVAAVNFVTDKCNVHISGSGGVEINVKSELDASITGSGNVRYKGNPSHVNSHSSGSGHILKL